MTRPWESADDGGCCFLTSWFILQIQSLPFFTWSLIISHVFSNTGATIFIPALSWVLNLESILSTRHRISARPEKNCPGAWTRWLPSGHASLPSINTQYFVDRWADSIQTARFKTTVYSTLHLDEQYMNCLLRPTIIIRVKYQSFSLNKHCTRDCAPRRCVRPSFLCTFVCLLFVSSNLAS